MTTLETSFETAEETFLDGHHVHDQARRTHRDQSRHIENILSPYASSTLLPEPAKTSWYNESMNTNDLLARAAQLSDDALLAQVQDLAHREREATVALIAHLAELDERRLYLAEGYSSLFKYCTDVQALLRHQIPDGDLAQVFDRALDALLASLRKQKHAATARPREDLGQISETAANRIPNSRHIPASVRRAVWGRDGGRCTFVSSAGRRCDEEAFIEFHHIVPYAHGGPATVDNIELRCRAHNGYEAERYFGQLDTTVAREESVIYAAQPGRPTNSPRL